MTYYFVPRGFDNSTGWPSPADKKTFFEKMINFPLTGNDKKTKKGDSGPPSLGLPDVEPPLQWTAPGPIFACSKLGSSLPWASIAIGTAGGQRHRFRPKRHRFSTVLRRTKAKIEGPERHKKGAPRFARRPPLCEADLRFLFLFAVAQWKSGAFLAESGAFDRQQYQ